MNEFLTPVLSVLAVVLVLIVVPKLIALWMLRRREDAGRESGGDGAE